MSGSQRSLPARRISRVAAANSILKPLRPALLLGVDVATRLFYPLQLIADRTYSLAPF